MKIREGEQVDPVLFFVPAPQETKKHENVSKRYTKILQQFQLLGDFFVYRLQEIATTVISLFILQKMGYNRNNKL